MSLRELGIVYRMLPAQERFHRSMAKFKAYVGGYGSGKTYAGCHEAIRLSVINSRLTGMMVAPTYRMLDDAVIPAFREILDKAGISHTYRKSEGRLQLPWGSKVLFRSADNPSRLKGLNLAWVGIDEAAQITRAAWEVVISRLRHPDAERLCAFITTTPDGFNWLYEEFVEKRRRGYRVIQASTDENIHLPGEYVRDLAEAYDPVMVRQYLMGEFLNPASGRVYGPFDRTVHVRPDVSYDPDHPITLAIDFNVNPMHAAVLQVIAGCIFVVDEIVLASSNTYELIDEVRARYGEAPVAVYPDPTGRARKTAGLPGASSDFAILMAHGFEVRSRGCSPAVKDRVNAVNRKLLDASGRVGLYVSEGCRETIRSFEHTCYKPGSTVVDKTAGAEHMTDAIGYFVEYEYPIRPPARVEYTGFGRNAVRRGY